MKSFSSYIITYIISYKLIYSYNSFTVSYDSTKMKLRWSDSGVSVSPELKLLQYHIGQPLQLKEKDVHTSEKNGNFSRLIVYFRFERQIGHHLIQTFAPSTLVVVLSWFSFWLGLDAIPGRVTLLVTCMLTLVTMFTGLRSDIPPVAYVKAIDLWMAGCMVFVFSALGEFVVVKVMDEKYKETKRREKTALAVREEALTPWTHPRRSIDMRKLTKANRLISFYWKNESGQEKILWCEIDRLSRIIFPVLFLIFMVIYWPVLMLGKSYPIS